MKLGTAMLAMVIVACLMSTNVSALTYDQAVLATNPFAYWRLNEASGPTATNLGTVGAALNATYNASAGFTFQTLSLLPNGEDLSLTANGSTGSGGTEVRIPDNAALNTAAHDNKTVSLWFRADDITSARQVVYEQGGNTRGINIYVEEVGGVDTLFMGAWNLAESNWGVSFVSTPISAGQAYNATFVLEGDPDNNNGTDDGFVRGFLDGAFIGQVGGAGNLRAHGNNSAFLGVNENARFADGTTVGGGLNFAGTIDEVALWNVALDASQIAALFAAAQPVPEPATAMLGLLAAAALGMRRRRAA